MVLYIQHTCSKIIFPNPLNSVVYFTGKDLLHLLCQWEICVLTFITPNVVFESSAEDWVTITVDNIILVLVSCFAYPLSELSRDFTFFVSSLFIIF